MYNPNDGSPIVLMGDDDADLTPGESTVSFVCSANMPLPDDYYYKFRIWEPCDSNNHDTPIEIQSANGSINYDIEYAGDFAVQCAVCPDGGTDAECDWEAYTPATCN
jgi:hypothetical protein